MLCRNSFGGDHELGSTTDGGRRVAQLSWQLCQIDDASCDSPDALRLASPTWFDVTGPASIAALLPGSPWCDLPFPEIDDHDWWLRADVDSTAALVIDFAGLSAPAELFVDDDVVGVVEASFIPARCVVPAHSSAIYLRFPSLTRWLKKRRPRGRWRSTLVSAPGLRWARVPLLGRAPVYGGVPPVVGAWRPAVVHDSEWIDAVTIDADPETGNVTLTGTVNEMARHDDNAPVQLSITDQGGDVAATAEVSLDATTNSETQGVVVERSFCAELRISDPHLWWPRGYGTASLYRVAISVGPARTSRLFGFRSVRADRHDGGFGLLVNDVPVLCRGAVWTPPDPVAVTAAPDDLRRAVSAIARAHANMNRVPGGFMFEQPEFYDECARHGIMVWQDAMITTFDTPDELSEVVAKELSHFLDESSGCPSMVVVSGGNETLQQPEMLGVDSSQRDQPLLHKVLPRVVAEHSDAVYVASSPSPADSDSTTELAIRPDSGVAHWFGVGGYLRPIDDVKLAGVRFAAEALAFSIPPSDSFVERHFGTLAVVGHDPRWKATVPRDRTTSWDFEDVRDFYVREIFDVDPLQVRRADPQRYLQLGRLAIAEAMAHCYTYWRQPESRCDGALILNSRDLLPGAGWGLLDTEGTPKLPMAVLARVWSPSALTISDAGQSGIRVDFYNDGPDVLRGTAQLVAVDSYGNTVLVGTEDITLQPHTSLSRLDSDFTGRFSDMSYAYRFGNPTAAAVEVSWLTVGIHIREARVLTPMPGPVPSQLSATAVVGDTEEEWTLTVESAVSLRYVCVDAPGWTLADNAFHLLAGVPYTVAMRREEANSTSASVPRGAVSSIDSSRPAPIQIP